MRQLRTVVRRIRDLVRALSVPGPSSRPLSGITGGRTLVPAQVRRSYARKLFSLFLVVILLFAGLAAVEYRTVGAEVQSSAQSDVRQTAELQANQLGEWMQQRRETTRMLSAYDLYDSRPDHISETLDDERSKLPAGYTGIHYVDTKSGEVVSSSDDSLIGETPWEGTGLLVSAGSSYADDVVRTASG